MSKNEFIDYQELSKIDLYDLLNINTSAIYDDIKRAFKKLALHYHPDKNKNQTQEDKEIFENIQVAYFILSDKVRKARYDEARKQHQDLFYSLKNQSQLKKKKTTEEQLQESKKHFTEKVKELEKEHGLSDFQDVNTSQRLKQVQTDRSNIKVTKPMIQEFKHKVDGTKFNELFNKEIEDNKSYEIVQYKGESMVPVGNFVSLDEFGKLYVSNSNGRVFNNNYSTLDEAYNQKFVRVENSFNNHNYRGKDNIQQLNQKLDMYKRDLFSTPTRNK
jgi:curved DNA-binding protein CbpA